MKYEIYSGAGNDFVMINNLDGNIAGNKQAELTVRLCNEQFKNIDGVIFIDMPRNKGAAVRMSYYNRDGSFGAMCGNGARCTAQYVLDKNIVKENSFQIEALERLYTADIVSDNIVKISFPPVTDYKLSIHWEVGKELVLSQLHWMTVGSEHIIVFMGDIVIPKVTQS
jgi:diaminopimelate epimerase